MDGGTPGRTPPAARFAAAWSAVEAELDWPLLGRLHCHEGGEDFFAPEDRTALLEAGLRFADDLGGVLAPGGASLYVGAAVAELVPMMVEVLVLGRAVRWHDVEGPVTSELARALGRASMRLDLALPLVRTTPLADVEPASCDHVWLVSVLTDPDHFPALHDRLYGRERGPYARGPGRDLATGRGDPEAELARAGELVDAALRALRVPGRLSTTDEELELVREGCRRRSWTLDVPARARLSPVVGDPVRTCLVRA